MWHNDNITNPQQISRTNPPTQAAEQTVVRRVSATNASFDTAANNQALPLHSIYDINGLGAYQAFLRPYPRCQIAHFMLGYHQYQGMGAREMLKREYFQARFTQDFALAQVFFPTRHSAQGFPCVSDQSASYFRANPLLRRAHRKALAEGLHSFGLRLKDKEVGYSKSDELAKLPWLISPNAEGQQMRGLLLQMATSLFQLENKEVARNLTLVALKLLTNHDKAPAIADDKKKFEDLLKDINQSIGKDKSLLAALRAQKAALIPKAAPTPEPEIVAVDRQSAKALMEQKLRHAETVLMVIQGLSDGADKSHCRQKLTSFAADIRALFADNSPLTSEDKIEFAERAQSVLSVATLQGSVLADILPEQAARPVTPSSLSRPASPSASSEKAQATPVITMPEQKISPEAAVKRQNAIRSLTERLVNASALLEQLKIARQKAHLKMQFIDDMGYIQSAIKGSLVLLPEDRVNLLQQAEVIFQTGLTINDELEEPRLDTLSKLEALFDDAKNIDTHPALINAPVAQKKLKLNTILQQVFNLQDDASLTEADKNALSVKIEHVFTLLHSLEQASQPATAQALSARVGFLRETNLEINSATQLKDLLISAKDANDRSAKAILLKAKSDRIKASIQTKAQEQIINAEDARRLMRRFNLAQLDNPVQPAQTQHFNNFRGFNNVCAEESILFIGQKYNIPVAFNTSSYRKEKDQQLLLTDIRDNEYTLNNIDIDYSDMTKFFVHLDGKTPQGIAGMFGKMNKNYVYSIRTGYQQGAGHYCVAYFDKGQWFIYHSRTRPVFAATNPDGSLTAKAAEDFVATDMHWSDNPDARNPVVAGKFDASGAPEHLKSYNIQCVAILAEDIPLLANAINEYRTT